MAKWRTAKCEQGRCRGGVREGGDSVKRRQRTRFEQFARRGVADWRGEPLARFEQFARRRQRTPQRLERRGVANSGGAAEASELRRTGGVRVSIFNLRNRVRLFQSLFTLNI
nr:hypothetical protein Itr_chr13CG12610 [Ipomoea trifida]